MSAKGLSHWSGLACMVAAVLVVLATLIHPFRETPQVILEQEFRLVSGHWLYTFFFSFLLLGLPGLYAAQSERAGRFGLVSFLMVFFGGLFFVESNDYGFIAPVLAAQAPAMLDAINRYPSVAALNLLLIVGFFLGSVCFGIATLRAGVFPRWSGILMAIGSPLFLAGGALGQLTVEALWSVAILGTAVFGLGLGWAGYSLWSTNERARTAPLVVTPVTLPAAP